MKEIKRRVLNGDTLNNFKKEIASLAQVIDKADNPSLFDSTVVVLSDIL